MLVLGLFNCYVNPQHLRTLYEKLTALLEIKLC